jgi:hypothetical protein
MMRRGILALVLVLVAFSVGAVAVEWEEVSSSTEVVLSTKTGLPAVVFQVTLQYSEFPASYHLEGGWEIYEIVNGAHQPIEGSPSTAFFRGSTLTIASATSQIPIEAGKTYGARLSLQDTVNDLSYERTFTYSPAAVLPVGISLRGWNGSIDNIDLSNLPDEELEQLVLLHDLLKGYTEFPKAKTAAAFLRQDASARPDTAVLLDGEPDVGQEVDRCTYSACGLGCCSTCAEHDAAAQDTTSEEQTAGAEEPTPDVRIECIVYQGKDLETGSDEYVQIKNYGTASQDLLGWTIMKLNNTRQAFTFPSSYSLEPGASVRVYTNEIHPESGGFSFGSEVGIWTDVVTYPVSLVLIPMPPGSISSSGSGIRFTVTLTLYTYTLASRNDIPLIQTQLAQFGQDFTGSIYAGSGGSIVGGGKTIFVQDIAMQVLEAAEAEIRNR